jgi:hypothetical protein
MRLDISEQVHVFCCAPGTTFSSWPMLSQQCCLESLVASTVGRQLWLLLDLPGACLRIG